MPIDETLEALNDLVRAGKVRYIGASSGSAWRMANALSLSERRGWARFISMQNHYNLVYREEEREMIPLCLEAGVGLVPWSPLARGMLTRPWPADGSVRSGVDRAGRQRRLLAAAVRPRLGSRGGRVPSSASQSARGVTMAEVALAWLLGRPGVAAPIVGATKLEHLEAAIRAVDLQLTADERHGARSAVHASRRRGFTT